MSWPFVSGASSQSLTVSKSVTAGNLLCVFYVCNTNGALTPTISDSGSTPNSWAHVSLSPFNSASNNCIAMWYCIAKVTGSITVTIAGGGASFNEVGIGEWTPPFPAVIEEVSAGVQTTAGSASANGDLTGSVTTVADGDLVISVIIDSNALPTVAEFTAGTSPNAFTKRGTASNDPGGGSSGTFAIADFVQTAHGAINPTWTAANADSYAGITVAFKARAAGCTGHIQSAAFRLNGAGTTRTAVFANNPSPGNAVLVGVEFFLAAGTTTFTVKDGNNNVYTVTPNSPSALNNQDSGQSGQAYLLVAPSNADKNITVTFGQDLGAGGGGYIWVEEFSYVGVAAFDSDSSAHGSSMNPALPTIGSAADQLLHFNSSFFGTPTAVNSPWVLGTLVGGELNGYVPSSSGAGIAVSYQASGLTQDWSNMAQAIRFAALQGGPPDSGDNAPFIHNVGRLMSRH